MSNLIYQVNAKYIQQKDANYSGNPNIEALPCMLEHDEWAKLLGRYPKYKADFRKAPRSVRISYCQSIKLMFVPVTKSVSLAVDFDLLLRNGYLERNPLSAAYKQELLDKFDQWDSEEDRMNAFDSAGITTSGIYIMGLSGIGKTRTTNRILSRYPQVIVHHEYHGTPHLVKQLTYLRLECPENGRPGALAEDGLRKMDELLQTNYYEEYASTSRKFPGDRSRKMISGFLRVAAIHHVGVLIIDEIQNLRGAKEGRVLLNLLVKMSNEFNVPIILIGTPKAEHLLTLEFRQLRRGNGYGDYDDWRQMENNDVNLDWDNFVEKLWEYQFTSETSQLTPKIKEVMYKYSSGISDLTIKFYIAAQRHAILNNTRITPGVLNFVGEEEFAWAKKATQALQLGTQQALMQYEDLYFRNVKAKERGKTPGISDPLPHSSTEPEPPQAPVHESVSTSKKASLNKKSKPSKGLGAGLLAETVLAGRAKKLSAYKTLSSIGLITSILELLD
jgi:hypothetical protein